MDEDEKIKISKAIKEINDKINNFERESAIRLIRKVRFEHPGKEQIAYITFNTPLEKGTDVDILKTLEAEKSRLFLKLQD